MIRLRCNLSLRETGPKQPRNNPFPIGKGVSFVLVEKKQMFETVSFYIIHLFFNNISPRTKLPSETVSQTKLLKKAVSFRFLVPA